MHWLNRINPQPNITGGMLHRHPWFDPLRVIYDHQVLLFGPGASARIEFEDRILMIGGETWVIVPPAIPHTCYGENMKGAKRLWMHFDWVPTSRTLETSVMRYFRGKPDPQLYEPAPDWIPIGVAKGPIHDWRAIEDAHSRMHWLWSQTDAYTSSRSRVHLLDILLQILAPTTRQRSKSSKYSENVLEIRSQLESLATQPFSKSESIQSLLASKGKSYDHRARIFRRSFGVTPLQFVNSIRMGRARNLILETDLPVKVIAERLGFSEVIYFNRLFKKVLGTTPTDLRSGRHAPKLPKQN